MLEVGVEDDDLLLVHSQSEEGGIPRWNIQIEKEDYHKPFLGGFRDRRTMIEYHHAATQTPPPPKPADSQQVTLHSVLLNVIRKRSFKNSIVTRKL